MRDRQLLDDGWQFSLDPGAPAVVDPGPPHPPAHGWRPVRVPGFWQSQFRELARATGVGWYRVDVVLDDAWLGRPSVTVEFGAVSHYCQGWLNGHYLGDHEGGHLPFSWQIADVARAGSNELLVRVVSPSGDRSRFEAFPFEETLHGKRSWYGPNGGIWQDAAVECRPSPSISDVHASAIGSGRLEVTVELGAALENASAGEHIEVSLVTPSGDVLARDRVSPSVPHEIELDGEVIERWSPDSPVLYRVVATLTRDGHTLDVVERRVGFRTFGAADGRFVLNDEPITLKGVLDQDYWDGPGVPTSKQDIVDRFALVKSMGFNMLRCHVKVPDPRYLDAADEIGLLVWCEMPTTSRLSERARERFEATLAGMIERDRDHPCVVVWGIANESWGLDLTGSADQRDWLHDLFRRTKAAAPDRLIIDNSPCVPNFHIETDIEDFHFYAVVPEMRDRWDQFVDEFAGRADFTFSTNGDAHRTGTEPLVVSEFGAWGLPDLTHLTAGQDGEPWWFESGQEWADGAAYVHGAEERFRLWHLDAVFGSWSGLCLETQRRQFDTLRHQINTMRSRPEIAGYVLTELSDVHWEANGMLDMTGRPRSFVDGVAEVNQEPAIVPSVDRLTMWDDQSVAVDVAVVNDATARRGAVVRCSVAGSPGAWTADVGTIEPMSYAFTETAVIEVPDVDKPELVHVDCALADDNGAVVDIGQSVLVVPRRASAAEGITIAVMDDPALARRLTEMGYRTVEPDVADLRVMRHLSAEDHDFVDAGGTGLLLADDTAAFGDGFGEYPRIELRAWSDALFGGGEWVSAFSWLRRVGRFEDLPGGPMMDSFFEGLTPKVVITGLPPARFEYDVFAGVFVGWVHQIASLIARHDAGFGSLLISTLRLTERPVGDDPLADWLLHQLIATALEQQ